MPNVKISAATDAGTLLSSDMLPLARSGNTNAYHTTMSSVATFTNASLSSGAYGNVGRNLLHNPLFNIAQRGAGSWTAGPAYTVDRWLLNATTDTVSITQAALSDADRAAIGDENAGVCLQNVFAGSSAAGAFNQVQQRIENLRRLGGKTITVSFWAKAASGAPQIGVSIDQVFGSGGSPSAQVIGNGTASTLSTTWTRFQITFSVASLSGKTLGTNNDHFTSVNFWFSSGATNATRAGVGVQSGTISLWGVQLEVGSVATPLEKLDPQQDLAKCLRFYGTATTNAAVTAAVPGAYIGTSAYFPVTMRAVPTITLISNSNVNTGTPVAGPNFAANTDRQSMWQQQTSAAAGTLVLNCLFALSADL